MILPQQTPDGQCPQKIVRKIQRKSLPSGRIIELREVETIWQINGALVKDCIFELEPATADGTLPKDLSEVNECCVCLEVFSIVNLAICIKCGCYCSGGDCRIEIPATQEFQTAINAGLVKPQPPKFMCKLCYEKTQETFLDVLRRCFWRL